MKYVGVTDKFNNLEVTNIPKDVRMFQWFEFSEQKLGAFENVEVGDFVITNHSGALTLGRVCRKANYERLPFIAHNDMHGETAAVLNFREDMERSRLSREFKQVDNEIEHATKKLATAKKIHNKWQERLKESIHRRNLIADEIRKQNLAFLDEFDCNTAEEREKRQREFETSYK